mmetsp:Transcript_80670/g.127454  ORF Transcript_80670/g.127454 Transcript_80670/m.127454 type:complete len:217 (+) Transcript_80670:70-720(+)
MPKVRKTLTKKTSRKGSSTKASKLRPEDVPVPDDSDLEEEPKRKAVKAVKAVKDNGLSRGQRKRLQRRENFLRKFELAKVVQAQDEAKSGLDLSGLTDGLEEALETSGHVQQSLKRPNRKVQAAKDQREMKHFQNVLNFDAFKNDPFGALEQHLKNSIKLQKEEEVKEKVKQKQKTQKTPASAVKDKLKEQKRTGTKNAKSVKSVKGKFSKPKRHK